MTGHNKVPSRRNRQKFCYTFDNAINEGLLPYPITCPSVVISLRLSDASNSITKNKIEMHAIDRPKSVFLRNVKVLHLSVGFAMIEILY